VRPNNYFFCHLPPIAAWARRGRISRIEKIEKCKIGKIEISQITKTQNKRLETFDFTNFALQFARCALRSTCASDAAEV
jgi:hypothetical protein